MTSNIVDGYDGKPPAMRGRRVVYRPNHKSFGKFIKSDQVRDPTEEVAKDIADVASLTSPIGEDSEDGHMADRFKVKKDAGFIKVSRSVRVKVEVFNSDPAAAPNEFGNERTPRRRMLGKAGAKFGDFKPTGGPQ